MSERITSILPADGWSAAFVDILGKTSSKPVVAWCLVDGDLLGVVMMMDTRTSYSSPAYVPRPVFEGGQSFLGYYQGEKWPPEIEEELVRRLNRTRMPGP